MENGEFIERRGILSPFKIQNSKFKISSLPRALAVAPRLIGVHAAHPFEDALRVGLFHVGRLGSVAASLLALPRRGTDRFLRALWHVGVYAARLRIARAASPKSPSQEPAMLRIFPASVPCHIA